MNDSSFVRSVNEVDWKAWNSFVLVISNFLGNKKTDNYIELIDCMLSNLQEIGCRMSIETHFLHEHLQRLPKNLADSSEEQGERFHQDHWKAVINEVPSPSGCLDYYTSVLYKITIDMGSRFPRVAGCKNKGYCRSERRLDGKTVVLTGGNAGIGKVTAEFLWKRGADVVIVCRSKERGQDAIEEMKRNLEPGEKAGTLRLAIMDLGSFTSVRKCAAQLNQTLRRIDILINNAGVMVTPFGLTEDGFEQQFGINHLGHFLFTILLLPKIMESTPARIVNVSSTAHKFFDDMQLDEINNPDKYYPGHAYCRSKCANIMFGRSLAKRLRGSGVNVYSLHPGYIPTQLYKYSSKTFFPGFQWMINNVMACYIHDQWEGAQTTIHCAICETVEEETGLYYTDCKVGSISKTCRDDEQCEDLWNRSMEWVGLDSSYDPIYMAATAFSKSAEEDKTSNITAVA